MPLLVYSSSAGSGKTTTLVNEYLKIALDNPGSFRNILAITFTNKAANEMKERVIETLQLLSDTDVDLPKKLSGLVSLRLTRAKLSERANKLLSLILHNYDDFSISTIDSFIHRIVRTFATDVQLPQNFDVIIDENDIIPDIIQNLYDKVGADKDLTKVLVNFVLAQANEENNYDPTSKLVDFVKYHMKEDGFKHISKLDNLSIAQLGDIINKISEKIANHKSIVIQKATAAVKLCYSENLITSDFYQGKNSILNYFIKLREFKVTDENLFPGTIPSKTINEDKWFSAKATPASKQAISNISLQLTNYYNKAVAELGNYFFYRLLFSKIYSLALVHEISSLFTELTEQTGKVHISEFNKKISAEIAEQPVPFIYERLGRRYQYFLIDEFQDTSILQWYNLLPLIEESLANNNFNMLVGDAKQAIYRFRSGEVELFASLPDLYENDGTQLSLSRQSMLHREYNEVILSSNYRSHTEIIKFNNSFFSTVSNSLNDRIKSIYKDVKQEIPPSAKPNGLVSLNFIAENDAEIYEQEKLLRIRGFVEYLIENKFTEKDICILCRKTKDVIKIANYLIDNKYNIISSESLLIVNSPKVRLIIAFFKLMIFQDNEPALAELVEIYLKLNPGIGSFDDVFEKVRTDKQQSIKTILNYFSIDADYNKIAALSTYEVAEFIIRDILKMQTADVFVQYFLDYIFETKLPIDLFVNRWEDKKKKLFISIPANVDAIRIMTIHKAKGLDFPAVIVDAAEHKLQNTKTEYWEDINIPGLEELKVGLFPLTKKIEHINRKSIYEEEKSKTSLDFLNVIYVAFTRPVKALFAISQIKTGRYKDLFAELMVDYLKAIGLWDDNKLSYNFGRLPVATSENKNDGEKMAVLESFISSKWQKFISVAPSENIINEALSELTSKSYGNLIHKILSVITTADDIDTAINIVVASGLISTADIVKISKIITDIVNNEYLQKYFNTNLIVKNETEILLGNGEIKRPDKVIIDNDKLTIIDYKTGIEKKEDYLQLAEYSKAFVKLGYKNVNTILVYIGNKIKVIRI